MQALFLGAGATAGTLKDTSGYPPVAKQFGRALNEAAPDWMHGHLGLREVITHLGPTIENLGLEEIWTCIDYHAKLGVVLPHWPQWGPQAAIDLKRTLLLLYGRRCDKLANELELSSDYTLGRLISDLAPGDVLISFNYDTIAERLATRFGHDLRLAFSGGGRNAVHLAKPHGSVSWRMEWATRTMRVSTPEGHPELDAINPADVQLGKLEPLVLGAVPIKSELIREVQKLCGWTEVSNVVERQWKLVTHAVRYAEHFVIAGYSFPAQDEYGRFLLREAMRARPSLPQVDFYELEDREDCTRNAICETFQRGGLCPQYKGPVGPGPFPQGAT
jgi:hypothetical protein